MDYVSAPCIAPGKVEDRRYQANIARTCLRENTLVILPTGLGKTAVALRVAAQVLDSGKKVLMMAPTKPLVDQHHTYFSQMLDGKTVGEMNGLMAPAKRQGIVSMNDFIFCVLAEETGFVGAATVLALFLVLLLSGLWTAVRSNDDRGRLVVIGVMTLVFVHVYINIAMSIGLMPITGLPLPFISAGKTFLVILLASLGIVQSISLHREEEI